MVPNAASFKWRAVFMSGMRLAQLAKVNPWQKKKTDTQIRTFCFGKGIVIVSEEFNSKLSVKINLFIFFESITINFINESK